MTRLSINQWEQRGNYYILRLKDGYAVTENNNGYFGINDPTFKTKKEATHHIDDLESERKAYLKDRF